MNAEPGTHVTGQVSGVVTDKFTELSVQLGSESDVRGPDFVPLHRLTDVQVEKPPQRRVYVNSDATEYRVGDVVRDGRGFLAVYADRDASDPICWLRPASAEHLRVNYAWLDVNNLAAPLTLLVRDGKPVPQ